MVDANASGVEFLFKKNKVDGIHGFGRLAGPGQVEVEAADEEHGFAKKSNADYLRVVWVDFVDRCLRGDRFQPGDSAAARD